MGGSEGGPRSSLNDLIRYNSKALTLPACRVLTSIYIHDLKQFWCFEASLKSGAEAMGRIRLKLLNEEVLGFGLWMWRDASLSTQCSWKAKSQTLETRTWSVPCWGFCWGEAANSLLLICNRLYLMKPCRGYIVASGATFQLF